MGRVKEMIEDLQEQAQDRHIAKLLGISYDDLQKLTWELYPYSSDDEIVVRYIVEFSESSPQAILNRIQGLDGENKVFFAPWEIEAEYDYINDRFDAITESKNHYKNFLIEINQLSELSKLQNDGDSLKKVLNRQVYIGLIGTLETFLSDVFLKLVFENESYFRSFVKNYPKFKELKFELRDIFEQQEKLKMNVKKTILNTIFHNLPTVSNMYKATFGITFPNFQPMQTHVLKRHDLVHRSGKTKAGIEIEIRDSDLNELSNDLKNFVNQIANELNINIYEPNDLTSEDF